MKMSTTVAPTTRPSWWIVAAAFGENSRVQTTKNFWRGARPRDPDAVQGLVEASDRFWEGGHFEVVIDLFWGEVYVRLLVYCAPS